MPVAFDVEGASRRVAEEPDFWTDGSLVDDRVSGASSVGAGCFTYRVVSGLVGGGGHWDDDFGDGVVVSACCGFCSVPGRLQSVQRAELWGVILALQANDGVHLGIDNLGVVRLVGKILDSQVSSRPRELLQDGDLLLLIERMLHLRELSTVRISKVKGHADGAMVRAGIVRDLDRLGNKGADEAADFGRGRVPWWVKDARRNFSGVCSRWRPVVLVVHRFFIAISRAVVNHDGSAGTSIDLWFGLLVVLLRNDGLRCGIGLFCMDRLVFGLVLGSLLLSPLFLAVILRFGLFSVGMLVKWVGFLSSLHWPADECNLGVGGVSYVELLIFSLEKAVPRYRRPGRSISVSAVPFGRGTDIWRSCRFLGALFRGLRDLPFGHRRFVPCDIGANHCRLRHIGWERCGHGLTSRPRG